MSAPARVAGEATATLGSEAPLLLSPPPPPPPLPPAEPSPLLLPLSEAPLSGAGDGPEPSVLLAPDPCCSLPPAAGDEGDASGDAGGAGDALVLPDAPLLLLGSTVPVVFCVPLASVLLVSLDGAAAGEAGGEAAAAAAGAGAPAAPGQGLPRPVLPGL